MKYQHTQPTRVSLRRVSTKYHFPSRFDQLITQPINTDIITPISNNIIQTAFTNGINFRAADARKSNEYFREIKRTSATFKIHSAKLRICVSIYYTYTDYTCKVD